MKFLRWFIEHPVAANLLLVLLLVGGGLQLSGTRSTIFPTLSPNLISISVQYPGASPLEVEKAVCTRLENHLRGLQDIDSVRCISAEAFAQLTLDLIHGADIQQALDTVKTKVAAIDSFPEEVEEPVVQEVIWPNRLISIAVSGSTDPFTLRRIGERLRDEINQIEGITQVLLRSQQNYEIIVEVSEKDLIRFGLTFDQIAHAIRSTSVDVPGGAIETDGGEILLRVRGEITRGEELRDLIVYTAGDGSQLRLGDVATVSEGLADMDNVMYFDGQPAILLDVFRVGDQDALAMSARIKNYLDQGSSKIPEEIQLTLWQDETRELANRLGTLQENGRAGFLLVVLVLALCLRPQLAMWVALGIPISIIGSFWFLPFFDITLNLTSLMCFIIVLGIVVDDAVVVGENIYRHHMNGLSGQDAAARGVQEVAIPVIFSALTTILAFSPFLALPGILGQLNRDIPIVVFAVLTISLLESILILPSHLSHLKNNSSRPKTDFFLLRILIRIQDSVEKLLIFITNSIYIKILDASLRWKGITFAFLISLFLLTFGMISGGYLKFVFFPPVESNNIIVSTKFPEGTPSASTRNALDLVEETLREIQLESAVDPVSHILTSIGSQPSRGLQITDLNSISPSGSHLGEMNIELVDPDNRQVTAGQLSQILRKRIPQIPEILELKFTTSLLAAQSAVNIRFSGSNLQDLAEAAEEIKRILSQQAGVFNIADSLQVGKPELHISATKEAELFGVDLAQISNQVRQAFHGQEVQRLQRNQSELKIWIKYPHAERQELENLERMYIRYGDREQNQSVPLELTGSWNLSHGYSTIERVNGNRTLDITAEVDTNVVTANQLVARLEEDHLGKVLKKYPGIRLTFEGEQKEQQEAIKTLQITTLIAYLLIYILLAIPFGSYIQPFLIASSIPFGFLGAIWGHIITGHSLSITSILGMIAMSGVIINNSLVLIDFSNRHMRSGMSPREAAKTACAERFRPIILTSLTTFVGLLPLLFEDSIQAQFLTPMAASVAFGVLFGTLILLIVTPLLYEISTRWLK